MKLNRIGLWMVVVGLCAMVGTAIASDGQPGGSVDTRTIVMILCSALIAVIGLYVRTLDAKVDKKASIEWVSMLDSELKKKADAEMVKLVIEQTNRVIDAVKDNVNQLNTRMHTHANNLHEVRLVLAAQHPTKKDLQDAVALGIAPLVERVNNLSEQIDELKEDRK